VIFFGASFLVYFRHILISIIISIKMCSICLPRFDTRYRNYCAARRKRRKRKVVRFAKTIDVISLSVACSEGLEVHILVVGVLLLLLHVIHHEMRVS
jgi:cytochrome c biogenesis protein ResB